MSMSCFRRNLLGKEGHCQHAVRMQSGGLSSRRLRIRQSFWVQAIATATPPAETTSTATLWLLATTRTT